MGHTHFITDREVKALEKQPSIYKIPLGGGGHVEVKPSGVKTFRYRYKINGKETMATIGQYPAVTLAEARDRVHDLRKKVKQGISPTLEKREAKAAALRAADHTFAVVMDHWLEKKSGDVGPKTLLTIKGSLRHHVIPYLGAIPISKISRSDVSGVLRRIVTKGSPSQTRRVAKRLDQIFAFAYVDGLIDQNPAWQATQNIKKHTAQSHRTLDLKDLQPFLVALETNVARSYPTTRRALKFALLTFPRPGEAGQLRWEYIDWANAQIIYPAEVMKGKPGKRRPHTVPMSSQVVKLLKAQQDMLQGLETPWVFPGQRDPKKSMSNGTLNKAIRDMGFGAKLVAHGFRAFGTTQLREVLGFENDLTELQLSHVTGYLGKTYQRAERLPERAVMMQAWADFIEKHSA